MTMRTALARASKTCSAWLRRAADGATFIDAEHACSLPRVVLHAMRQRANGRPQRAADLLRCACARCSWDFPNTDVPGWVFVDVPLATVDVRGGPIEICLRALAPTTWPFRMVLIHL